MLSQSTVYSLFRGEGTEEDLAMAGHSSGRYVCFLFIGLLYLGQCSQYYHDASSNRPSDEFYALFYLGLYCEAKGETTKASQYMRQAARSDYANTVGRNDYMTSVARVRIYLRVHIRPYLFFLFRPFLVSSRFQRFTVSYEVGSCKHCTYSLIASFIAPDTCN